MNKPIQIFYPCQLLPQLFLLVSLAIDALLVNCVKNKKPDGADQKVQPFLLKEEG